VRDLLQQARATEDRLQNILGSIHDAFIALDRSWKFTYVNRAYMQLVSKLYASPDELIGHSVWDRFPDLDATESGRLYRQTMAEQKPGKIEIFYEPIGAWLEVRTYPTRETLSVYMSDITERKTFETELAQARDRAVAASRAKDDFLAALSHELRTPLNPVLLLASDAARNPELPPNVRADFETISKHAQLEARLIDDLLDLTRITRGKMSLELRPVELHSVLRDAIDTVQSDLAEKQIAFRFELAPESPMVMADPVRLQQVFWNVLKNAVKFTKGGGSIVITTRADGKDGDCHVEVADSGIGMTPLEVARVFDSFAQGDHAGSTAPHRFGGLGLGLAISRVLIEMHFGRITAASAGRDKGATFTITLPQTRQKLTYEDPAASNPPFLPTADGQPAHTVLLVEDHGPTRAALARLLVRRRYKVVEAGSAAEALERAAEAQFDLVISDIGLPDQDGYQLMTSLRDRHGLRGIALSGYGMEQDIARGRRAGFIAHLIKPVSIQALESTLATVWN
jgi:PAS domain S-box-containing protein